MQRRARMGWAIISTICLLAGPAWAEPQSFSGTGTITIKYTPATAAVTFTRADTGTSNDLGRYTCMTTGDLEIDVTEDACEGEATGFRLSNHRAECSATNLGYPYETQYEDSLLCLPSACYAADPPQELSIGCAYVAEHVGVITGGDGETQGVTGSVTITDTVSVGGESSEEVTVAEEGEEGDAEGGEETQRVYTTHYEVVSHGTTDVEFIESEEEQFARDAFLEVPPDGSTVLGIGFIGGWSCLGGTLEVDILEGNDIITTIRLPHGSSRADTESVCGDVLNGFGAIWNWSNLPPGPKTIRLFINGELRRTSRISVLHLTEEEFLRGASGSCTIRDFPSAGQAVFLEWNEAYQKFEPTRVE